MMKYLFLVFIPVLFLFAFQTDPEGLGYASIIQGKEVYILSKPARQYKVIEDFSGKKAVVPSCNIYNIVEAYLEKAKKEKIKYDALIIDDQDNILFVKFL